MFLFFLPHTQGAQAWIIQCYMQLHQCLPLPHKRSPDSAAPDWGCGHLIAAYYSYIYPERMKGWVGLVGWPTADGLPTLSDHPSAAGRAQDRESLPVKDRRSTNCATQPTNEIQQWGRHKINRLWDTAECGRWIKQPIFPKTIWFQSRIQIHWFLTLLHCELDQSLLNTLLNNATGLSHSVQTRAFRFRKKYSDSFRFSETNQFFRFDSAHHCSLLWAVYYVVKSNQIKIKKWIYIVRLQ